MSIEIKRGIHFIPGRARTIDILPSTQKTQFLVGLFRFFSKISQISVLIIHDSSFSGKSVPWTWILRFFFRLIFIFICIVWRSPNKNTILHAGQKIGKKLGVLRAFATYKMTITMTSGDFLCSLCPSEILIYLLQSTDSFIAARLN